MAGVTGRETRMAFGKMGANSWGVPTSVTFGIYMADDGGIAPRPTYVDDEAMGQAFMGPADVGDFAALDVTMNGQMYYDDPKYRLEAYAMGSPNAVSVVSSQGANSLVAYRHIIDLATNVDGLAPITWAIDRVLYVEEMTSAKVYGFGFSVGTGGVMTESFRLMGTKTTNASSVNLSATLSSSITMPEIANRVFRKQGVFRMNAQSSGSLTASDALEVEDISFEWSRPQDAPNVFGQDYVTAPADNGHPTFQLRLTFPRMTTVSANSLFAACIGNVPRKADLTFTGAHINSTTQRQVKFEFPYLEVREFSTPISGANQVKPQAVLALKKPSSAPTGMSGITQPFRLTRISPNSAIAF